MLTCQQHNLPSSSGREVEDCLLCLLQLSSCTCDQLSLLAGKSQGMWLAVSKREEWEGSLEKGKHLTKGGRKKGFVITSSFHSLQASRRCPGVPAQLPATSQQQSQLVAL